LKKIWLNAAEIAAEALPCMPTSKRGVNRLAEREGWAKSTLARKATRRGAGTEYHYSILPPDALQAFVAKYHDQPKELTRQTSKSLLREIKVAKQLLLQDQSDKDLISWCLDVARKALARS
jgi:hypothetical protein